MRTIFDGHLDLSWNALSWGRDITLDLDELNRSERGMTDHPARGRATTTLPELRRGSIAACQATVLARARPEARPHDGPSRLNLDYMNQALDAFGGPVLASHNNCRELVPDGRQFSDEQIRRLLDRGAVIGAALDAWMLAPGWVKGKTSREVIALDAVADHIDHVCQLAGNARHAAIGSDLDGGFGTEQVPTGLDRISDLQRLDAILSDRGYPPEALDALLPGNWLRFLH